MVGMYVSCYVCAGVWFGQGWKGFFFFLGVPIIGIYLCGRYLYCLILGLLFRVFVHSRGGQVIHTAPKCNLGEVHIY